jgi:hypothetical protein
MSDTAYAPSGAKRATSKAGIPVEGEKLRTLERPAPKAKPAPEPAYSTPEVEDPIGKRIEEMRAQRKSRNSQDVSGFTQKLSVPENLKDPRLVYRWVNDTSTRHHEMQQKGWAYAESMDIAKDARNSGTGSRIERIANERTTRGTPQKTFLMVKPREFYEEDKASEAAKIKAHEKSMNGKAGEQRIAQREGGGVEPGMYIPSGGMTIERR